MKVQPAHNPAYIWPFDKAPKELQELSTNGGDEDWLVLLPPEFDIDNYCWWLECTDSCRDPKHYPHPTRNGWTVVIGSHA